MASLLEQADLAFKATDFLKAYDFYCQAHKEYKNDALLMLANECLRKNLPNERLIHSGLSDIKIACIMDEFTWANFSPEANFFQITPENFKNEIEEFKPDLLFIESAWRGKDGLWDLKIAHNPSQEYLELIYFCRYKKIPIIFWNKEDPIHFSVFYKAAKLCDFIFSTDTDSIAKYKYFFAHERVFLLPFACQPLLQNPIENQKPRERAFCYAGSYYERFPEKMQDLDDFVNTLPEFAPVIIYDRNYGKNMPGFSYPADYSAIIRAGLEYDDINIAYKGYEFGINLNSVKNSQSMFARRVFELMASNTLVVSNYSPGIYAFFGDLVFMSDHGKEIIARIEENTQNLDLIRLNALTKVLAEHTYEQRLCYLIEKITGEKRSIPQPLIACFAIVHSKEQIANILANWKCQTYANRSLTILGPGPLMQNLEASEENVLFLQSENLENIEAALPNTSNAWLAILSPDDWYGANYLKHLLLASKYASTDVIGKDSYYRNGGHTIYRSPGKSYAFSDNLRPSRSLIRFSEFENVSSFLTLLYSQSIAPLSGFSVDPYDYCESGSSHTEWCQKNISSANFNIYKGLPCWEILGISEKINKFANFYNKNLRVMHKKQLYEIFSNCVQANIIIENGAYYVKIRVNKENNHQEILKSDFLDLPVYKQGNNLNFNLAAFSEHICDFDLGFYDFNYKLLMKKNCKTNIYYNLPLPKDSRYFNITFHFNVSSCLYLNYIEFNEKLGYLSCIISRASYLLITQNYPDYHNIYQSAFIHTRLEEYKKKGLYLDIFILKKGKCLSFREYAGIHIIEGDISYLKSLLSLKSYKKFLVHFLLPEIWNIIKEYKSTPKLIWVHGYEIQPYYRRLFNWNTKEKKEWAKKYTIELLKFWKEVFESADQNLYFVFVSQTFANEVMEDHNFQIEPDNYIIINNPINTKIFKYRQKTPSERYKLLSIRSFASPKYANDLTAKCVQYLAKFKNFHKFEILIIGDGPLFDSTLQPLKKFNNVKIKRGFLRPSELAAIHDQYGVFLTPTRWESQGVSRDEAMSSGLVPITNAVGAIPEFVDEDCGVLARDEDYTEMAEGILNLVHNPDLFLSMSQAATENVRATRSAELVITRETDLILSNDSRAYIQKFKKNISQEINSHWEDLRDSQLIDHCNNLIEEKRYREAIPVLQKLAEIHGMAFSRELLHFCRLKINEQLPACEFAISVIIPCYNTEKYIGRALDSILQQTLKEVEIIIYDDCSSDRTIDVIEKYMAIHKNISLHKGVKNIGQGKARNMLLHLAKGEYITFMDSDDYYNNPDFFKTLYGEAKANKYDVVITRYQIFRNSKLSKIDIDEISCTGHEAARNFLSRVYGTHGPCAKLFKRDLAINSKFGEYGYSEDMLFSLSALLKADSVKILNFPGYVYFVDNMSSYRHQYYQLIHLFSSLRLLAETFCKWLDLAKNGICLDIAPFVKTWQIDHGKLLATLFSQNHLDQKQINFIIQKFQFIGHFVIAILGYDIGKYFLFKTGHVSPDPAYNNYRSYLTELKKLFSSYFCIKKTKDGNEVLKINAGDIPDDIKNKILTQINTCLNNMYDIVIN